MIYKEDVEAMLVPDAAFVQFRPRCHPDASVTAVYSVEAKAVIIACGSCGFGVIDFPLMCRPRGARKLELVKSVPPAVLPTHVQDQRAPAKKNRSRKK